MNRSKYSPPKNPTKDKAMDLLAEVEKRRSEINLRWGEDRFKDLIDPENNKVPKPFDDLVDAFFLCDLIAKDYLETH